MEDTRFYLGDVARLIGSLPVEHLERLVSRIVDVYEAGRGLFLVGNGGSAATCSHMATDFQKCVYLTGGKPFRCMSLTDNVPLITAWANDTAYDRIFAEQLQPWVQAGDLVFCVSGSGNSPNVLHAARAARELGAHVVGLSGFAGGQLAEMVDEAVVIPCDNMQRIEDLHMITLHVLFWRTMQEVEARRVPA